MSESEFTSASHPSNLLATAVQDAKDNGDNLLNLVYRIGKIAVEAIKNGGFSEDAIIAWLEKVWAEKVVPHEWSNRPRLEAAMEKSLLLLLKALIHSAL